MLPAPAIRPPRFTEPFQRDTEHFHTGHAVAGLGPATVKAIIRTRSDAESASPWNCSVLGI
jgi:hypothetical protein